MIEKIVRTIVIAFHTTLFISLCMGLGPFRYHSFYPWHSGGDYMHLSSERDLQMLPWVREFK